MADWVFGSSALGARCRKKFCQLLPCAIALRRGCQCCSHYWQYWLHFCCGSMLTQRTEANSPKATLASYHSYHANNWRSAEQCRALAWRLPHLMSPGWDSNPPCTVAYYILLCRSHANCWVCRFRTWTSVASDIEQGRRVDWDAGLGETQKGNRVSKHRKCPLTVTLHFRCKTRNMLALARRPQIPVTENQSANVSLQGLHFISFPRFQYFQ